MFNVTIHVHYNCQMRESLVISAIRPTKRTSDSTRSKNIKYNFDQPRPSAQQEDLQIMQNERLLGRVHSTEKR